jgi:hypothetical protein
MKVSSNHVNAELITVFYGPVEHLLEELRIHVVIVTFAEVEITAIGLKSDVFTKGIKGALGEWD